MAEKVPLKVIKDVDGNPVAPAEFQAGDTIPSAYLGTLATGGALQIPVYNQTGGILSAHNAVYVSGFKTGDDLPTVDLADASDSVKMPALGILAEDLLNNATGLVVALGLHDDLDTSSFAVKDPIYVSPTTPGAVTNVKPAAAGHLIQKIGIVTRSHINQGALAIFGAGRSNDVPNSASLIDLIVNGNFSVATQTPASAAATGIAGTIAWDANYIYICIATNIWKRVAIATW